jgi:hypothetical protein
VVSLRERRVWVMRGADTLRNAEAAVASGMTIEFAGRSWTFRTPRGRHTVLRKVENPVWRPPDWLYAEAALDHGLELARLRPERPVRVADDEVLVIRNGRVGLLNPSTRSFAPLPVDEHIVFNDTLYIPPVVTQNRRVEGELGRYALDLGDGYLIHGTSDPKSIGRAVTGCQARRWRASPGCTERADGNAGHLLERRRAEPGSPVPRLQRSRRLRGDTGG